MVTKTTYRVEVLSRAVWHWNESEIDDQGAAVQLASAMTPQCEGVRVVAVIVTTERDVIWVSPEWAAPATPTSSSPSAT